MRCVVPLYAGACGIEQPRVRHLGGCRALVPAPVRRGLVVLELAGAFDGQAGGDL